METGFAYNTGSGLSTLDDQHLTRLTVDELIVDSDLQLPNGLVLPTDLLPLQTMRNNINALTDGQLMINTGTDTFTSTANNSSNWDTAYTQSQTNATTITDIKGSGYTNQTIKGNADAIATNANDITTNQNNIGTNTAFRSDFNSQTTSNLLFRD